MDIVIPIGTNGFYPDFLDAIEDLDIDDKVDALTAWATYLIEQVTGRRLPNSFSVQTDGHQVYAKTYDDLDSYIADVHAQFMELVMPDRPFMLELLDFETIILRELK